MAAIVQVVSLKIRVTKQEIFVNGPVRSTCSSDDCVCGDEACREISGCEWDVHVGVCNAISIAAVHAMPALPATLFRMDRRYAVAVIVEDAMLKMSARPHQHPECVHGLQIQQETPPERVMMPWARLFKSRDSTDFHWI